MVFWCCVSTGQENPVRYSFGLSSPFPVWVNLWVSPVTSKLLTKEKLQKQEKTLKPLQFQGLSGGDYWTRTSGLMRVKHAL